MPSPFLSLLLALTEPRPPPLPHLPVLNAYGISDVDAEQGHGTSRRSRYRMTETGHPGPWGSLFVWRSLE